MKFGKSTSTQPLNEIGEFLSAIFPDGGFFTTDQHFKYKPFTKLDSDEPQYYAICAVDSKQRKNENFKSLNVLVFDDIGTKALKPPLLPSYVIETSSGNYQWGCILETPETDAGRAKKLIDLLVKSGYSDPGASGIVRLVRLPAGVNGKDEKDKKDFKVVMTEWHPGRKHKYDDLYSILKKTVNDRAKTNSYDGYEIPEEVVEGNRNTEMTRLFGHFISILPTVADATLALYRYNQEHCKPPLESKELDTIIASISNREESSGKDQLFGLEVSYKTKKIPSTLTNVHAALEAMHSDEFARSDMRYVIGFDEFRGGPMYHTGDGVWKSYNDNTDLEIRLALVKLGFSEVSAANMADARDAVAHKHPFDSAQMWLTGLPAWDGVPRVRGFCHKYLGGVDSEYMTAVSEYMWTAMAGRIMVPGIQADMMPVLQGLNQGEGKTTSIRALAPSTETFCELSFTMEDKEFGRLIRGKLVAEIAELKGLGARDSEHVKAVLTRRTEETRGMHKNFFTQYERRCVLFGTTNQEKFLNDPTGSRRYLPFITTFCDREAVSKDRDQLWAEGLVLFNTNGVMWQDAQRLAPDEHKKAVIESPLEHDILVWLSKEANQKIVESEGLSCMLIRNHLDITGDLQRTATLIGTALSALGYVRKQRTINKLRAWYYFKE